MTEYNLLYLPIRPQPCKPGQVKTYQSPTGGQRGMAWEKLWQMFSLFTEQTECTNQDAYCLIRIVFYFDRVCDSFFHNTLRQY